MTQFVNDRNNYSCFVSVYFQKKYIAITVLVEDTEITITSGNASEH